MRNYEKLCELLRHEFSPCPEECEYFSPGDCEAESCPYTYEVTGKDLDCDAADAIEELLATVKRLEPKRGIWVEEMTLEKQIKGEARCSMCGHTVSAIEITNNTPRLTAGKTNYCPNCGAKMREWVNNE